ncbi:MAG TPA: glycosyltransferase family 2 protein [Pyrinomonadaceae bacterium]|jgi:hypothetical protein
MAVELSIIIVNWNGGEFLRRCIESLLQFPPSIPWEIIVVDNASTDDSLEWIRTAGPPNLRLIENSHNPGYGAASNQGMRLSTARMLFLLNNDAEVRSGTIDRLISTLNSEACVGACGPRIIGSDGVLQRSVWRNLPRPWEMIVTGLKLHRLIPKRIRGELLLGEFWDHARRRRVDMLSGAATLAKRELIDEVGGFDERFHMYFEDHEWCLRAVRAGWVLIFEPEAVVMHHGGQATKRRWNQREQLLAYHESKFLFHRTSLPRWRHLANLLTMCALSVPQLAWRKLRGKPTSEEDLILRVHFAELRKSLRGRNSAGS